MVKTLDKAAIEEYAKLFSRVPDFVALKQTHELADSSVLQGLYNFYEESEKALRELLSNLEPSQETQLVYNVIGHGDTCFTKPKEGEPKRLTGLLGPMLDENGVNSAIEQHNQLDKEARRFCSWSPRALNHAILRYDPTKKDQLAKIASKKQLIEEGIISRADYLKLIDIALNLDIIVSPLIGPQYFAFLDGQPKDPDEEKLRRQLMEPLRNSKGDIVSEDYNHFFERGRTFLDMLVNKSQGIIVPRADLVTHSGLFNIAQAYFRYLDSLRETKEGVLLKRTPTTDERGKLLTIKLNSDLVYLNDSERLKPIKERTSSAIDHFRALSHDKVIKGGNGIVEAEFFALNKRDEEDKKTQVSIDDLLREDDPALVLGNCGMGKTTFSLYLASKLTSDSSAKYIPVLVRLRKVSNDLGSHPADQQTAKLMKSMLSAGVIDLPEEQLEEFKKDGYKFVFILDGHDELHSNYKENVSNLAKELNRWGKVIVTSRTGGFEHYEHNNPGFRTVNLDQESIEKHTDQYLESRIGDESEREKFKGFLMNQSEEITKNWLMISILTQMYSSDPSEIDLSKKISQQEVMEKGIELFVWEHALERKPSLFKKPVNDGTKPEEQYQSYVRDLKKEAKAEYLAGVMPYIRKIGAYMTVNDKPLITSSEVQMILNDKWTIISETEYRQGKRTSRFLD